MFEREKQYKQTILLSVSCFVYVNNWNLSFELGKHLVRTAKWFRNSFLVSSIRECVWLLYSTVGCVYLGLSANLVPIDKYITNVCIDQWLYQSCILLQYNPRRRTGMHGRPSITNNNTHRTIGRNEYWWECLKSFELKWSRSRSLLLSCFGPPSTHLITNFELHT